MGRGGIGGGICWVYFNGVVGEVGLIFGVGDYRIGGYG